MHSTRSPLPAEVSTAALAEAARSAGPSRGVVAATVAGNALEFYDFVTYAFFAVYIGRAFFPASTPLGSLLLSVAVFGVGFVSRPLGGVLIGHYADRAGRRPAMLLTITLITVGTAVLALTPPYSEIGILAPLVVVAARLVQGLALGGEVGPATAFLIEIAPPHRRGYSASWQLASQGTATLAAGILGVTLTATLTPAQLESWGWRVPFGLGLLLVPIAVYLRRHLPETLHGGRTPAHHSGLRGVRHHRRILVLSVLLILGGTVSTYVGNFMTTFAIATLKMPPLAAMTATVVGGAATFSCSLLGGWLSDRFGRRPTMLWPRILLALLCVPAFHLLIAHPTPAMLCSVTLLQTALTALSASASIVAIPEFLPRGFRATGLSLAYAVAVTVFGGTTQFIVTWLIGVTGNPAAPAWYVAGTSVLCAGAMMLVPETLGRPLED